MMRETLHIILIAIIAYFIWTIIMKVLDNKGKLNRRIIPKEDIALVYSLRNEAVVISRWDIRGKTLMFYIITNEQIRDKESGSFIGYHEEPIAYGYVQVQTPFFSEDRLLNEYKHYAVDIVNQMYDITDQVKVRIIDSNEVILDVPYLPKQ